MLGLNVPLDLPRPAADAAARSAGQSAESNGVGNHGAGSVQLKDDFKSGLFRTWDAAFDGRPVDFDVAWSLELIDAYFVTRSLPIGGRSAEAAIYCGLRALHAGERLDQCIAITAASGRRFGPLPR